MKTAKEWLSIFADSDTAYRGDIYLQDILAVQADALRHAAKIADGVGSTRSSFVALALNEEAEKLEGK